MAHYVISDIHGEAERFHAMLAKIRFSEEDTLYILGDVIDRGPDGIQLLLEIIDTPNMVMLLGNHEYMMLACFRSGATALEISRWDRNGNTPTKSAWRELTPQERGDILFFLRSLPGHLELTVNGKDYYLVHGFPGESVHDEVWLRPTIETPNPILGRELIVGHTPVLSLLKPREERLAYLLEMENRGEHFQIFRAAGFTDIDCGCGHGYAAGRLACLRLEDNAEFYT